MGFRQLLKMFLGKDICDFTTHLHYIESYCFHYHSEGDLRDIRGVQLCIQVFPFCLNNFFVSLYACMCVYLRACVCLCVYLYLCESVCLCTCARACVYICMCLYVYICVSVPCIWARTCVMRSTSPWVADGPTSLSIHYSSYYN